MASALVQWIGDCVGHRPKMFSKQQISKHYRIEAEYAWRAYLSNKTIALILFVLPPLFCGVGYMCISSSRAQVECVIEYPFNLSRQLLEVTSDHCTHVSQMYHTQGDTSTTDSGSTSSSGSSSGSTSSGSSSVSSVSSGSSGSSRSGHPSNVLHISPPIYMYYELNGLNQNDALFLQSKNEAQLEGTVVLDRRTIVSSCGSVYSFNADNNKILHPCGAYPRAFFNDTVCQLSANSNQINISNKNNNKKKKQSKNNNNNNNNNYNNNNNKQDDEDDDDDDDDEADYFIPFASAAKDILWAENAVKYKDVSAETKLLYKDYIDFWLDGPGGPLEGTSADTGSGVENSLFISWMTPAPLANFRL
eukprot:GHVQ01003813.1.p1 GENE.GHVQ01003813.1~~GHVQ01003813.1.p1  ORF type:complete len:361 (-),score=82.79 GHVQ01003813.1:282-1364(-)